MNPLAPLPDSPLTRRELERIRLILEWVHQLPEYKDAVARKHRPFIVMQGLPITDVSALALGYWQTDAGADPDA